jgi:hypothetical protein
MSSDLDGGTKPVTILQGNELIDVGGGKLVWVKELVESYQRNRWIPIRERVPEIMQDVVIAFKTHRNEIGSYMGDIGGEPYWCLGDASGLEGDITHWIPLPELSK